MVQSLLLGVDGGGTKTGFALIDRAGRMRAVHRDSGSYYPQIGLDGLRSVLERGLNAVLARAGAQREDIGHAFFGLPSYGEDSALQLELDQIPYALLGHDRYRCGNDMVCTWAGSLAGGDGIGIVAGTGTIGYGERAGHTARASGWGELFGDEGSAHWIAVRGLNAFSRMADGRLEKGPLYETVRRAFGLTQDLDLCARLYGPGLSERDRIASLSELVATAADAGDTSARAIFAQAGWELAQVADSLRRRLGFPPEERVPVSYSGGVFNSAEQVLAPLRARLAELCPAFELRPPLLPPDIGAAIHAARIAGLPLDAAALEALRVA